MKKGIFIFAVVLIAAIVVYVILYMRSPIQTQRCERITYEESLTTRAVFVREERVYSANGAGTVFNHYSDGDRVANGACISTIYSGEVSDELLAQLSVVDRKIKEANTTSSYGYSADTQIENRVEGYRKDMVEAAERGDAAQVGEDREKINTLRVGDSVIKENGDIKALMAEQDEIEDRIGLEKDDIKTDISGVFATVLDGLENVLTYDNAKDFTREDFERIKNVQGEQAGNRVLAGDDICKVVNNHEWYVLVVADNKKIEKSETIDHVNMRFDIIPGEQIDGRIEMIKDNGDGTSMLLLRSAHYLEGAFSFRVSNATIVFRSFNGYKIPAGALVSKGEDQTFVNALRDGKSDLYPVEVTYRNEDEGFVIVDVPKDASKSLDKADEIVISTGADNS